MYTYLVEFKRLIGETSSPKEKPKKSKGEKCQFGWGWAGANEAQQVHHCSCGAHLKVTPKHNPRIGGEILPGWHVRIPSHQVPVKK